MARQRERDEFISRLNRELPQVPIHEVTALARKLMRYSATLHRLAEAMCNGDYPADNGERKVSPCSRCESLWVPSSLSGTPRICKDCRTQDLVSVACQPYGIVPDFQGDPRGCVLSIKVPSGQSDMTDRDRGVCVP